MATMAADWGALMALMALMIVIVTNPTTIDTLLVLNDFCLNTCAVIVIIASTLSSCL